MAVCVSLRARAQFIHAILVRKTQLLWRIKMNLIMLYRSCNSTIIYSCRRKLTVYCFTSTNCNCLSWQLRKITSINIHVFGYYFLAIICKTFMSVLRAQMRVIWRKIHYLSLDVFCSRKDLRQPEWRSSFEIPWICASEGRKVVFHNTSCWKELMITLITISFFRKLILL